MVLWIEKIKLWNLYCITCKEKWNKWGLFWGFFFQTKTRVKWYSLLKPPLHSPAVAVAKSCRITVMLLTPTEGDPVLAERGSLRTAKSSTVHQVLQGMRFHQSAKGRERTVWLVLNYFFIWLLSPKSILESHFSHPLHHSYNPYKFSLEIGLSFGICFNRKLKLFRKFFWRQTIVQDNFLRR